MSGSITGNPDPFKEARSLGKTLTCEFQGKPIPMILGHSDVRAAARDWKTYSSNAPFRVPIPSEEDVRSIRQLPVEIDPPEHTDYRAIVEPFFLRAKTPEMEKQVSDLILSLLNTACSKESIEIVREFALPIQSHALTYLLNVPETEAATWISWGTHVFRDGGKGKEKGAALEDYLNEQLDKAHSSPGSDFFSALNSATFRGRRLTREEMLGFANLTFAGGRDTIINTIAGVTGYLGKNQEAFEYLRNDPKRIVTASEEFFRVLTPLTHIARVCPGDTQVHGVPVKADERVSICWASANHDETVFENPEQVQLDRRPNPHVAFGFGPHLCLGAQHARLITRTLLEIYCSRLERIEILSSEEHFENEARYKRAVGFEHLIVKFIPKSP